MNIKDSPPLLLVLTGSLMGLTFPLGKLANQASISPITWALMISAGAGCILLLIHVFSGGKLSLKRNYLTYYFISSILSLVIPNILIFNVIPKLGSGFTGILFTLSPIFTLALSLLWKVRIPTWLGIVGLVVGLLGAIIVTLTRGEMSQPASLIWILTGLGIPMSLALGNLYRALAWPDGANHLELAIGSNLAAAFLLFIMLVFSSQTANLLDLLSIKTLSVIQVIISAAMYSVFFRLQQVGGPTYLSQVGYIAAGVALIAATLFLGERYSIVTWVGAAVIVIGTGLGIVEQRKHTS
jgi:drug/metabolite transporter (DMT)-like permease